MSVPMPEGFTTYDLYQAILNRPIGMATNLGLHVKEKTSEGYIQETFRQLNEKYGFDFEIPFQAKPLEDSPEKVQKETEEVVSVKELYDIVKPCGTEAGQPLKGIPIKLGV